MKDTRAEILEKLGTAMTDEEFAEKHHAQLEQAIATAPDYKARRKAIDALSGAHKVAHAPNPALERCRRRYPDALAHQVGGKVRIVDGVGRVVGEGSTLTRACKAALRGGK